MERSDWITTGEKKEVSRGEMATGLTIGFLLSIIAAEAVHRLLPENHKPQTNISAKDPIGLTQE